MNAPREECMWVFKGQPSGMTLRRDMGEAESPDHTRSWEESCYFHSLKYNKLLEGPKPYELRDQSRHS